MPKNIVIFSDGTGQRGGISFDERRSNIYKLFRATRCGPDSTIDPFLQLTYYDPGLGTIPEGTNMFWGFIRKIHNIISQATGLGITTNVIDCYAEIIQMYEPGDRIYLVGFSRGAYTVRCLASVLRFCGVPTTTKDGSDLKYDGTSLRSIARDAVDNVYQHVGSPNDTKYVLQREAIAARFREQHHSATGDGPNVYPYFIGVFDTVAAIANPAFIAFIAFVSVLAAGAVSWLLNYFFGSVSTLVWFELIGIAAFVMLGGWYIGDHLKFATGLRDYTVWDTLHFTSARMRFYDYQLNTNVGYARHAISIDEYRKDFARVPWGNSGVGQPLRNDGKTLWFKQLWFAGNHSDIGGSYPENESRLSDITLKWMIDEAQSVPDGLQVDGSVLKPYPSAKGMQHDETRGILFRYAGKIERAPVAGAPLHPSVKERFEEKAVLQYDEMKPYRPEGLREHPEVVAFYETEGTTSVV